MSEKAPRRTQESRSAETRAKLMEAAVHSLHTRGYAATTTMIVAEDAGVSRGAMLHQFPSRVDLMLYVVETIYRQELDLYRQLLAPIADPRERVQAMPEIAWEVLSRPAGIAVLEVLQGSRSDPELAERLRPMQIEIEKDSFRAIDRVAAEAGVVMPSSVKRLIVWSVRGLSVARMLTDEPDEIIKSVRLLKRLLTYGLEKDETEEAPSPPPGSFRVIGRLKT